MARPPGTPPPPPHGDPNYIDWPSAYLELSKDGPVFKLIPADQLGKIAQQSIAAGAGGEIGDMRMVDGGNAWIFALWRGDKPVGPQPARDRAVQGLKSTLAPGETLRMRYPSLLIKQLAAQPFIGQIPRLPNDGLLPQTFGDDGKANPDGPIEIDGVALQVAGPRATNTVIRGSYDVPLLPNPDFTVTIAESVEINVSHDLVLTTRTNVSVDASADSFLIGGALAILGWAIFGPAGIFFGFDLGAGGVAAAADALKPGSVKTPSSFGKVLTQQMFPPQFLLGLMLNSPWKMTIDYTLLDLHGEFMVAGGTYQIRPALPQTSILGPSTLASGSDVLVEAELVASPFDLRGYLAYSWTSSGKVQNPHDQTVRVSFRPLRAGEAPRHEHVDVKITDVDGLSASATHALLITPPKPLPPGTHPA